MSAAFEPLRWPDGWPRMHGRESGTTRFKHRDEASGTAKGWPIDMARQELVKALERMRPTSIVVTENPTRGVDVGIAVYWRVNGRDLVMACDQFDTRAANMRAITLVVEGLRTLERYGGTHMMDRAFDGFLALPPPEKPPEPWHEVFMCTPDAPTDLVEAVYRHLVKKDHPDAGGSDAKIQRLNGAIERFRRERGNG